MNAAFEYDDLVHRFLDGLCTETESAVLFEALSKSSDLQEVFQRAVRLQTILRETASSYVAPADLAARVMQSVGLEAVPDSAALASASQPALINNRRFFIPMLALGFFAAGILSTWMVLSSSAPNYVQSTLSQVTDIDTHSSSQAPSSDLLAPMAPQSRTSNASSSRQLNGTDLASSQRSEYRSHTLQSKSALRPGSVAHARSLTDLGRQDGIRSYTQTRRLSQAPELLHNTQERIADNTLSSTDAHETTNNELNANHLAKVESNRVIAHLDAPSETFASTISAHALTSLKSASAIQSSVPVVSKDELSFAQSIVPSSVRCSFSALATRSANVAGASMAPLTQDIQLRDWSVGCLWKLNSWLDLGFIAGNEYLPLYVVSTTENTTTYELENSRPWVALNSQMHCNLDGSISEKSVWQWLGSAHVGMSNAGTHLGFSIGIAHSLTNTIQLALSPEYRLQFLSDGSSQYRANRLGFDLALFYTL